MPTAQERPSFAAAIRSLWYPPRLQNPRGCTGCCYLSGSRRAKQEVPAVQAAWRQVLSVVPWKPGAAEGLAGNRGSGRQWSLSRMTAGGQASAAQDHDPLLVALDELAALAGADDRAVLEGLRGRLRDGGFGC